MKKLVHFTLAALFLLGIASAQNIPAMDVFGGYSYLSFHMPANAITSFSSAETLTLNGWDFSASVSLFHHLAVEGDIGGHQLSDCGFTILNCSNLSYMGGARFNVGNRSRKLTGFVHGLVGQDRMDLLKPPPGLPCPIRRWRSPGAAASIIGSFAAWDSAWGRPISYTPIT